MTATASPAQRPAWAPAQPITYLLKHQNPDGSWAIGMQVNPNTDHGITVATSALACLALLEYVSTDPTSIRKAVEKGSDYVIKTVYRQTRGSSRGFGSPAWGQIYAMELFAKLLTRPEWKLQSEKIRKEADGLMPWLLESQTTAGGWGYNSSFQTAAALIALHHAKSAGLSLEAGRLEEAADFLTRCWTDSKGFRYSLGDGGFALLPEDRAREDGSGRLGACAWALHLSGRLKPGDLDSRMGHLMDHREYLWRMRALTKEKQFPSRGDISAYAFFTYYGVYYNALALTAVSPEKRQKWGKLLQEDLMTRVDEDGTWSNILHEFAKPQHWYEPNVAPGTKIYSTAMSLLALRRLEHALAP